MDITVSLKSDEKPFLRVWHFFREIGYHMYSNVFFLDKRSLFFEKLHLWQNSVPVFVAEQGYFNGVGIYLKQRKYL